jgi:uncharacterized protein YcbX
MPEIVSIYRYPVKGLSPEPLASVRVAPGGTLPFDRAWAIENGRSKFDPAAPKHLPKIAFLMLMRNERLAALQTGFDEATRTLTVRRDGAVVAEGSLETEEGRAALAAFFDAYEADELRGPARIVSAPGHAFTDTATKCLSLINLATVRDIEQTLKLSIHPLRFRANLYVEGLPAWAEFDDWLGKTVVAGGVTFAAYARIDRCAATNVNPQTAERDLSLPRDMLQAYGHADCGVYLQVLKGGQLTTGMPIMPA